MQHLSAFLLIIFLLISPFTTAHTLDPEQLMEKGNEAYQAKVYEEAIETYEAIVAAGFESAALYYNLGNSYYQTDQLGRAVLNYERARLLAPRDPDIRHNLAVVRQEIPDQLEQVPEFFLSRWWRNWRETLSPGAWGVLGLLLLWAGIGGLALWLLAPRRKYRKWGFLAGVILLLLSALPFGLGAGRQAYRSDTDIAVILSKEVVLRSAPDQQSQSIITLHEGLTVDLLDTIGDWYKVRLPDGEQGWLPMKAVEEV